MRNRIRTWIATWAMLSVLGPAAGLAIEPAATEEAVRAKGEAYARLMRALFAVRNGRVAAGVEEIHAALERLPDSPDLQTEAAQLLLQWTGRVGEAERLARRALELDADHLGATRFLAEVNAARALGPERDAASRDEAIRLFERLATGDTVEQPDVLQMLVQLRLQAGDRVGALSAVQRLVAERPGDLRATQTLAQLLLRVGREVEALDALLVFLVDHPFQEDLLGWAEQLANSQRAWARVVEFLASRAPFQGDAALLQRFHGEALLRVGQLEAAAGVLREALRARPHDARARKDLALAYRGMGRMAEAATIFRELARESPDYPFLQQLLAETLSAQRDVDGALGSYRTALGALSAREDVAASHRDAIRQQIAILFMSREAYGEAASALGELELPGGPIALEIRCRLAIATAQWDEARRTARALAATDEAGLAALLEGEIAAGEGRWGRADAKFTEAIDHVGPYQRVAVAEVYREAGRPGDGLKLLRAWAEADPELADARFHLGVYLYALDRLDEAERELREAFRLDPEHDRALNFLGYSLAERKIHLGEALEMIERALEVDAWNGAYLDSLGWVYHQMGRYDEALQPLERAARELPKDATVLEHLGDVYLSLGERQGAVTAWNRALVAGAPDAEGLRAKIRRAEASSGQFAADEPGAPGDRSPR